MLSPLTGFDKYEEYYNRVQTELIGLTTSADIEIKSQSKHFLERVFGTKTIQATRTEQETECR